MRILRKDGVQMGIEKIASAGAAPGCGTAAGGTESGGQISELRRLEQSIRKMANEYRIKARAQGVPGAGIQSKLREFDSLIDKIDDQISRLERSDREKQAQDAPGTEKIGVSVLHYNTTLTMVALRNSGKSMHTALQETSAAQIAHAEQAAAQRQAEQKAPDGTAARDAATLDLLI